MEIHHVIQAAMMSRAPEKKSRMINPSPQEKETCKDWLEKKKISSWNHHSRSQRKLCTQRPNVIC